MKVKRRDLLKLISAGAVASTFPPPFTSEDTSKSSNEQKLHHDYQSNNEGTEYYFLGNGLLLAALQTVTKSESGTHCGLLLMSSDHFGRKISTLLFHPERGLQNSRFFLTVNGKGYAPEPGDSTVQWIYPDDIPTVMVDWQAGNCSVRERLYCPMYDSAFIREVTIKNTGVTPVRAIGVILLYPNLMYFDEYDVDRKNLTLTAIGYHRMQLFSPEASTVGDRHMHFQLGELPPGKEISTTIVLTLNYSRRDFEKKGLARIKKETGEYWQHRASLQTGHNGLNHLFNCSKTALRAVVARSGKVDGGVWQYNFEWVRDQSIQSVACVMVGHTDAAKAILRRILTRSVSDEGKTVDASRHRPPETIELDQNGALLYGLWAYWVWTGDDSIMNSYWKKIQKVADYVLQPVFRDPAIGLVKNSREFWERDPNFGVKEGYELAYQFFNILGLRLATDLATHMGDRTSSTRWSDASGLMKESFLHHPKFSLVENGRFIKRRLVNGEVQETLEPPNRKAMPAGMPLNVESISYCDPDAGNVLPIAFEIIDPKSSISLNTLESMEQLWNQRWNFGGYARYHVSSEPDSPGPWPFATLFIARAYLEAGNDEKVWRSLQWLLDIQGGKAGAWLEYYGDRPTPPLPPVGIVVWTWAELLTFFVHHMLGVRPSPRNLVLRPKLLSGLNRIQGKLRIRGYSIALDVHRDEKSQYAVVNGSRSDLTNRMLELPLPQRDMTVEMHI